MSGFSEQDSVGPDNPEPDHVPLRSSERVTKLGPLVSQEAESESFLVPRPALLARKAIDESARRTRDLEQRAALMSVAARAAAVAGVVAVAVLLFVMVMKPASRQSVASQIPSETTGSTPQSNQGNGALAELKAVPGRPGTHEQSQELLQRFLQWREKTDTTETSQ